jgi:hypothetical protein
MKLGLFYQSGYKLPACYHALKQFRKFYPTEPVAFYEDNTDILKDVADKFNCDYKKTDVQGYNTPNFGKPVFGLTTLLPWLKRMYDSCLTTLSEVDYVLYFEDDVWVKRRIEGIPPYDLTGIRGIGWDKELYDFLGAKHHAAFGCGGCIFNRLKFIEAYENLKDVDWEMIDNMAKSPKPSEWGDSALTFMFLHSKMTTGPWSELVQYRNQEAETLVDRRGWLGTLEELENKQGDCAIIHCWKPYYYPTEEEINNVKEQLYGI